MAIKPRKAIINSMIIGPESENNCYRNVRDTHPPDRLGSVRGRELRASWMSPSVIDRFWRKVNKTDSCWLWTGAQFQLGYGCAYTGKRPGESSPSHYAHRVSYALAHGVTPSSKVVMHTCDVPLCVNPDHLQLGTQGDNNRDRSAKGRDARTKPRLQRLSDDDVRNIRCSREPKSVLAHRYGVHVAHIRHIRLGTRRKAA